MTDRPGDVLRVLFLNENIGGHATVHHHLRRAVAELDGVDATFVDVPPPGLLRKLLGAPIPGLARLDLDLQPLRAQLALSAWVRRRLPALLADVDVAHVYTQNSALLSSSILSSTPTVLSTDSTNAENAFRLPYRAPTRFTAHTWKIAARFERRVFAAVDAVVANSEWVARSLHHHYGLDGNDLEVLPFGITAPARCFDRPAARRPRIVFVGRQFERKGGPVLLEAFRRVADRADLTLVTQEAPPGLEGVTVVDDLHQGDDRLWELLHEADIFAFPSGIDQAPNAVLEAMVAGLPVVAVDTAAVGEMVLEAKTGFLIDDGDAVALGDALERLVDDPSLRATMGAAGRAHFDDRYDARQATRRLIELLAEAAGRTVDTRA